MTERIIIIGRSTCPFCIRALSYCVKKDIERVYLDYASNPEILEEYKEFHNHSTVPIILSNDLHTGYTKKIGGYSDLLEYL